MPAVAEQRRGYACVSIAIDSPQLVVEFGDDDPSFERVVGGPKKKSRWMSRSEGARTSIYSTIDTVVVLFAILDCTAVDEVRLSYFSLLLSS